MGVVEEAFDASGVAAASKGDNVGGICDRAFLTRTTPKPPTPMILLSDADQFNESRLGAAVEQLLAETPLPQPFGGVVDGGNIGSDGVTTEGGVGMSNSGFDGSSFDCSSPPDSGMLSKAAADHDLFDDTFLGAALEELLAEVAQRHRNVSGTREPRTAALPLGGGLKGATMSRSSTEDGPPDALEFPMRVRLGEKESLVTQQELLAEVAQRRRNVSGTREPRTAALPLGGGLKGATMSRSSTEECVQRECAEFDDMSVEGDLPSPTPRKLEQDISAITLPPDDPLSMHTGDWTFAENAAADAVTEARLDDIKAVINASRRSGTCANIRSDDLPPIVRENVAANLFDQAFSLTKNDGVICGEPAATGLESRRKKTLDDLRDAMHKNPGLYEAPVVKSPLVLRMVPPKTNARCG